jgi:Zn-dependent protease with chaperone function
VVPGRRMTGLRSTRPMEDPPAANPAVLAVAAGAPGAVVVLVAIVLFAPVVAVVLALVVWAAVAFAVWRLAGRAVLGLVKGHEPDLAATGPARLANVIASVSAAAGVPPPALLLIDDPAPNALVTGRAPREVTFVATTGLVERLDRLQLEAVVAHQLALVRAGGTHARDVATLVLGVPGTRIPALAAAAARATAAGDATALSLDAAAVGVTRYPPALLAALEVAADGPTVSGHAALAPLWWVPRDRGPLDLRLAYLRELT